MRKADPVLFQSEANEVTLKCREGKTYIEKRYQRRLKNYFVDWPVSRAGVEAFLLQFLSGRTDERRIQVPKLYRYVEPDLIEMEYCAGTKLMEMVPEQLCDIELWKSLFSFLYDLKEIKEEFLRHEIGDAFAEQQEIFCCMKHWKFEDKVDPPENSYGCLALGDVSLSNILISEGRLRLLDFECAHWGYTGYDIGQILGMAEIYLPLPALKTAMEQSLEESVPDLFYRECCLYWKKKFLSYYRKKSESMCEKEKRTPKGGFMKEKIPERKDP